VRDTRTRLKTAGNHCILHLICELEHTVHVGLGLLAFLYKRRELFIHSVVTAEECVHFIFFDREACLDRLLASPVLAVGLTLHEDLVNIGIAIPAEPNCLCTFCLLETAQIEFEVFVVKIDRCYSRVLRLKLLVGIKYCNTVNLDGLNPLKRKVDNNQERGGVA
jgi:hypothetical protein